MAIARKIDPAALARSFADEISAVPEVKRLWYWSGEHRDDPERLVIHFYALLDPPTKTASSIMAESLTRLQERYFDDALLTLALYEPPDIAELGLRELIRENSVEIPLSGV